jgi:molybdate transport system ATP-binding protein
MIEVKNIRTVRSGKQILQGLSWKINTDEHWVIDGPNGSGKTSLLEALSGKNVQGGSIDYDFITGESWEDQFNQKRQFIQYIPAHAIQSLVPSKDDLYYQQRYYSIGDEISIVKVSDILDGDIHHFHSLEIPHSFDIAPLLDREVKRLSNGQLKKVLILQRLLHHLPKLLLLDYPFEGLDRESRKDLCAFIDFVVEAYSIQVVIVDHGHELPKCITHRLTLNDLRIESEQKFVAADVNRSVVANPPHRPSVRIEPVVDIVNLRIQYGETVILQNFNWTVHRGERWALIGANGSGKTTLFSIIFADHPMAYSQQVYLFGRRRGTGESIWEIKSRINYMGPELISYLDTQSTLRSAREYIVASHKNDFDDQKFDEFIRFFEVQKFIGKPLRHLSSGQLQLTLLINCFMSNKELLLLDEPFQFLSPHVRDLVCDYLQGYLSDDVTLILITHYEEDLVRWTEKTMRVG